MGFTERVTRLNDHDRRQHSTQTSFGASSVVYRPAVPRLAATMRPIRGAEGGPSVSKPREIGLGHPRHVPEAWPALLSRDQLCAYIGVSADTLAKICTVRPLDLGANLTRYNRTQIDSWLETLPPRLMIAPQARDKAAAFLEDETAVCRTDAALSRVRARAERSKWRKSA